MVSFRSILIEMRTLIREPDHVCSRDKRDLSGEWECGGEFSIIIRRNDEVVTCLLFFWTAKKEFGVMVKIINYLKDLIMI